MPLSHPKTLKPQNPQVPKPISNLPIKTKNLNEILSDDSEDDFILIKNSSKKSLKPKNDAVSQKISKKCSFSKLPKDVKEWFREGKTKQESDMRHIPPDRANSKQNQSELRQCSVNLGKRVSVHSLQGPIESKSNEDDISK